MTGDSAEDAFGAEAPAPSVGEVASAYVDAEVGAEHSGWVDANRSVDAGLAADLAGFARVKDLLGGLERVEADPGTWDEITRGVRAAVVADRRRAALFRIAGVAAAMVLVFFVAFGALRLSEPGSEVASRPATSAPAPTRRVRPPVPATTGAGAVAAARGIGSVVERAGVRPRAVRGTTTTTSSRPPVLTVLPGR